ncbi:MAG: LacI family transcriptional regulator, partial [Puniceicoccaceae bacterium]
MRTIAEALGVSKSTISLALAGDTRVAEETRRRVEEKARELGYRRSSAISEALRTVRSGGRRVFRETVGCVLLNAETRISQPMHLHTEEIGLGREIENDYITRYVTHLTAHAERLGCGLDVFTTRGNPPG